MSEQVWRLTGYNRHPSLINTLTEEVLPIIGIDKKLDIATVPCSTGTEAISIAIALEKENCKYKISGFDVDEDGIRAARESTYLLNPRSGQIVGDLCSDYSYDWSNLSDYDRKNFFSEFESNGKIIITPNQEIRKNLEFELLGVQDIPKDSFDVVFCLNFLKYLTDDKFKNELPSLDDVSRQLYNSNKSLGALMVDPTSDKVIEINESLVGVGYSKIAKGTYLKY
jgi:chemotaxis methyl-accepting protein methylase